MIDNTLAYSLVEDEVKDGYRDDRERIRLADPVRTELARRGGKRVAELMETWSGEDGPELSSSYGWIARFVDRGAYCEASFQPAADTFAMRLLIGEPLMRGLLSWTVAELPSRSDYVIVTAPLDAQGPTFPRYDGVLVGICLTAPENFGIRAILATSGSYHGINEEKWPRRVFLPALIRSWPTA